MKRPIRILSYTNSSGSAYWRIKDPFFFLNQTGKFDCRVTNEGINRASLEWADIIITQSIVDKLGISLIYEYQQEHGKKFIVEQDDYFTVTEDNPFKLHHDITNASEVVGITMGIADMVTVSTQYLGEQLKDLNSNIKVLPNYMFMDRWNIKPKPEHDPNVVKILWAGSITHINDMNILSRDLERIGEEFPQVEFYFVGDIRMREVFKDLPRAEYMLGTDFLAWPTKLWGLRADIGIAPLKDSLFTRCKSAIKTYEYGINQIPCIASDMETYRCMNGYEGVTLAKDDEWYKALKELILDNDRAKKGKALYKRICQEKDLGKHIKEWSDAYKSIL